MSNFEKIHLRTKLLSVGASTIVAVGGAHVIESEGALQIRPNQDCIDAATSFPDTMKVYEKPQPILLSHHNPPIFIGKIGVSAVTKESGKVCPDRKGERVAKFILKINGEPVPQVVGFMGNHVEDKAKITGFATKEDCEGNAEVIAKGVYTTKVDLGNRTVKEKYITPIVKASC